MSNLCSQSLGRLTRQEIMLIEKDLRDMAEDVTAKAVDGGPSLESIYGRYSSRPHEFKFLEGEILCLLDLANLINTHGIKTFIKPSKRTGSNPQAFRHESATDELEKLKMKISAHFSNR